MFNMLASNRRVAVANSVVLVEDDGPGITLDEKGGLPDFTGVGIRNTRERLIELYGADHGFDINNRSPRGLAIRITLPLETGG